MVDVDYESLSLEELTQILKEVSRIVDKRVATEIRQYRSSAQKFAESIGLEVKPGTWDKMKDRKVSGEKGTKIYRHPENESLVWESTGRKPKWLTDLIKSGQNLDEFLVTQTSAKEVPQTEGVEENP
jgi:DNA-binding protein H-NS